MLWADDWNIEHFACSNSGTHSKVCSRSVVLVLRYHLLSTICCPTVRIQCDDVRTSFINFWGLFKGWSTKGGSLLRKVEVISRYFLLVFQTFHRFYIFRNIWKLSKKYWLCNQSLIALTDILFSVDEILTDTADGNKTFPAFDQTKIAALKCKQCIFWIIFFNLWIPRIYSKFIFFSQLKVKS